MSLFTATSMHHNTRSWQAGQLQTTHMLVPHSQARFM